LLALLLERSVVALCFPQQCLRLCQIDLWRIASFEPPARDADRTLPGLDRRLGKCDTFVQFAAQKPGVGDFGDQAQGDRAARFVTCKPILQRGLVEISNPAPQIHLPAGIENSGE
jgi:hypothetical protein